MSSDERDTFLALAAEAVDGLGRLVADHLRLVHLELLADSKTFAKKIVLVAVSAFLVLFGYAVAWLGIALLLESVMTLGGALLLSGSLHLVAGGIALRWGVARLRAPTTMTQTRDEMRRTVDALSTPLRATQKKACVS